MRRILERLSRCENGFAAVGAVVEYEDDVDRHAGGIDGLLERGQAARQQFDLVVYRDDYPGVPDYGTSPSIAATDTGSGGTF